MVEEASEEGWLQLLYSQSLFWSRVRGTESQLISFMPRQTYLHRDEWKPLVLWCRRRQTRTELSSASPTRGHGSWSSCPLCIKHSCGNHGNGSCITTAEWESAFFISCAEGKRLCKRSHLAWARYCCVSYRLALSPLYIPISDRVISFLPTEGKPGQKDFPRTLWAADKL